MELAEGYEGKLEDLKQRIDRTLRERLIVTTDVQLVSYGTLARGEYKTRLLDYSHIEKS